MHLEKIIKKFVFDFRRKKIKRYKIITFFRNSIDSDVDRKFYIRKFKFFESLIKVYIIK